MKVRFRIKRFDPERAVHPYWAEYEVELEPNDRVLDGLHYIKWFVDGTLTLRRSCAHGICGSDAMKINGRNRLACKVLIQDAGPRVVIEPLPAFRVIKDLVVDMESFFEQYRSIMPYLVNDDPPSETERLQTPEDRARYDDTTKCILCAACTLSCPVYWANHLYVGPAAIVNAHRFMFDSRDQATAERLTIMDGRWGALACRTIWNCTDACPRGIEVTKAIQDVKRALLGRLGSTP